MSRCAPPPLLARFLWVFLVCVRVFFFVFFAEPTRGYSSRGGQGLNRERLLEEQLINRQPPRRFPPARRSAVWRGCFSLSAAHTAPGKSRLVAAATDCIFFPFFAGVPIQTKARRE